MAVAINKVVFRISTIDHYFLQNYTKGLHEVPCMLLIFKILLSQRHLKNLQCDYCNRGHLGNKN